MVEKNKLLSIYEKLGGTNTGDSTIISSKGLSSIMVDRLKAEFKNLNIDWSGNDEGINDLLQSSFSNHQANHAAPQSFLGKSVKRSKGVGIDIQVISDLPDCTDFWGRRFLFR